MIREPTPLFQTPLSAVHTLGLSVGLPLLALAMPGAIRLRSYLPASARQERRDVRSTEPTPETQDAQSTDDRAA